MDRRRGEYVPKRRQSVAGYDVRPVAYTRRVVRPEVAPRKPDVSAYRIGKAARPVAPKVAPIVPVPTANMQTPIQKIAAPVSRVHEDTQDKHRHTSRPLKKVATRHRRKRRLGKSQLILTSLAVLVFLTGVGVSIDGFRKNQIVEAQVTQQSNAITEGSSDDVLDETKPDSRAIKNHTVPADAPKYIIIDKIKVKARVKALDTKASGELAAPNNIFDAGWYQSGNKPGQDGAMLIDGHVSGPRKAGVFKNLPKLQPGDIMKIERGDGAVFQYKVVKSKAFPADKVDMQSTVVPITPGKRGLNLITCHGKVKPGTTEFSERYVVYAEEI